MSFILILSLPPGISYLTGWLRLIWIALRIHSVSHPFLLFYTSSIGNWDDAMPQSIHHGYHRPTEA